jgi:hypothetical protein
MGYGKWLGRGNLGCAWKQFRRKTREPFSVEAAIRYLETQSGKSLAAALDYIRRAPQEIQTPLRKAVNIRWPEQIGLR